jgi:hypothetical protein
LLPLTLRRQQFFPAVGAVHLAGLQFGGQAVALLVKQQQQRMMTGGLEVTGVGAVL